MESKRDKLVRANGRVSDRILSALGVRMAAAKRRTTRLWISAALIVAGLALVSLPLIPFVQSQLRIASSNPAVPDEVLDPESRPSRPVVMTVVDGPSGSLLPGGDASGSWRIYIPRINLGVDLVEGTTPADLKQGPGVYPEGVRPGQHGNLAIAGHRNAHGSEFWYLDRVKPGDPIYITIGEVCYRYDTERQFVVASNDWSVIGPTDYNALTLTTCHPLGSTAQRLVVRARLAQVTMPAPPAGR